MSSACKSYAIDIIGLRKPTALDKVTETVSKPKGAVPNFGLPKWKVMPLESKIPMVPGPEGAYNFTRRKLGKRLWISSQDAEFNLSDPYGYEMNLSYDALHDKHLVPFFSRKNNMKYLLDTGLVTSNLDVKCSLRDYNMYRKYLRRLHCDSIRKELRRSARLAAEERALQYAEDQAQKEAKKLKEREKLSESLKIITEKRRQEEQMKIQRQKDKARELEERLKLLEITKREEQKLRQAKTKERAEYIRQKRKTAAEIEKFKVIKTLLEWNKKEHFRKKAQEVRLTREKEEKRKALEKKWEERQNFQIKQIEKERFLLQCVNEQREKFIKEYNEKVERETKRMQRLFENMRLFVKCYIARHLPGRRERICCRKDTDDNRISKTDDGKTVSSLKSTKKRSVLAQKTAGKRKDKRPLRDFEKMRLHADTSDAEIKEKKQKTQKSKREISHEKLESFEPHPDVPSEVETLITDVTQQIPEDSVPKDKCRCKIIKTAKQLKK